MSLPQRPSLKVKVVRGQIAGRFALDIGPFIRGKCCPQRRGNLLCQITLDRKDILHLAVVRRTPKPLVRARFV